MSYREDISVDIPPEVIGKNYLVIIAIDQYQHGVRPLSNPVNDANAIKDCLINRYQFTNDPKLYFEKLNTDATRSSIIKLFEKLLLEINEWDNLVLYFAGHGNKSTIQKEGYWLLSDAEKKSTSSYLNEDRVVKFARNLKARNVFLIIDSCYSGSIFQNSNEIFPPKEGKEKSRFILTSGRNYERVSDGIKGKNSPFCKAILKVLKNNHHPELLVGDICRMVPKVLKTKKEEQTPRGESVANLGHQGGDFAFLLKKQYIKSDPSDSIHEKIKTRFLTGKPPLPKNVIGRTEDIKRIHSTLKKTQRIVLLNGMGGIGKTTTAIVFLYKYMDSYKNIVWLKQFNDFATSVSTNYELSKNLKIKLSGNAKNDTRLILNKLANLKGKSLLVIDNGNEQLEAFKGYLPISKNWDVLITARGELSFTEPVKLGFLNEEDALKLFYTHYLLDRNDLIAKRILSRLDYHTLTIEILAKTMQSLDKTSLDSIDRVLDQKGIAINNPVDLSSFDYPLNKEVKQLFPFLLTIFELDKLSSNEYFLLKQFIALPPDFHSWGKIIALLNIKNERKIDEITFARNQIKKKGWLLYDDGEKIFKMHLVIQDVLRVKLAPGYSEIKHLINSISKRLELKEANENPAITFPWIKYGESILKTIPKHDSGAFITFKSNLALRCMDFGKYYMSKKNFEDILEWYFLHNKKDASKLAIIYSNLAQVCKELGIKEKAMDYAKKAYDSDIKNFGEKSLNTATKKLSLATIYSEYGDNLKASKLLESALDIFRNSDSNTSNHQHTIIAYSSLASVYANLTKYEVACDHMKNALVLSIQFNGPEHHVTAIIQSNLATIYMELNKTKEACSLIERGVKTDIRNFGIHNPNTKKKLENLIEIYKAMGNTKGIQRIQRCLKVSQ